LKIEDPFPDSGTADMAALSEPWRAPARALWEFFAFFEAAIARRGESPHSDFVAHILKHSLTSFFPCHSTADCICRVLIILEFRDK